MHRLHCELPDIKVTKPKGLSRRLFFKAYSGPNAIGFAQLSTRTGRSELSIQRNDHNSAPGVSYCLKIIEVSHNYRNKGIGSALLDEVINFCKEERVASIYGEAKGEIESLRRWYKQKGFELDEVDNIQLSLTT